MYPVLCVWNCITAVYVPDRNAANWKYIRCPDADFICGSHVLWGGIYITNPRTEACESGDCITAFKYTLYANCKRGNRPSFIEAGAPDMASEMYEYIIEKCKEQVEVVERGRFGADMKVSLINDGPFTIVLDSETL